MDRVSSYVTSRRVSVTTGELMNYRRYYRSQRLKPLYRESTYRRGLPFVPFCLDFLSIVIAKQFLRAIAISLLFSREDISGVARFFFFFFFTSLFSNACRKLVAIQRRIIQADKYANQGDIRKKVYDLVHLAVFIESRDSVINK